jgi:hypothetical protein
MRTGKIGNEAPTVMAATPSRAHDADPLRPIKLTPLHQVISISQPSPRAIKEAYGTDTIYKYLKVGHVG